MVSGCPPLSPSRLFLKLHESSSMGGGGLLTSEIGSTHKQFVLHSVTVGSDHRNLNQVLLELRCFLNQSLLIQVREAQLLSFFISEFQMDFCLQYVSFTSAYQWHSKIVLHSFMMGGSTVGKVVESSWSTNQSDLLKGWVKKKEYMYSHRKDKGMKRGRRPQKTKLAYIYGISSQGWAPSYRCHAFLYC